MPQLDESTNASSRQLCYRHAPLFSVTQAVKVGMWAVLRMSAGLVVSHATWTVPGLHGSYSGLPRLECLIFIFGRHLLGSLWRTAGKKTDCPFKVSKNGPVCETNGT